ncbi:helix-turn-helix domain-containing protein [Streptomyces sp. NRRL S-646]|uniref:helix-turn-helix domain-containing protein n=1 Tax=Streptomyces sp. NRRL S-646 TaxID=1463917 RepID=UPI0004C882E4|nr:helix-turn-helix transcriptional regulator [Streptomyces sp. NRRL S-646]
MSEASEAAETEAFARQLRELKDRSGLSYGALAKRLHMSTSTLHRYCNGTAVPIDYAPVERLARVCRATPQELVELHRRWILADATRGRRAEQTEAVETVDPGPAASQGREGNESERGGEHGSEREGRIDDGEPVVVDAPRELAPPGRPRRRRTVLIASVAVAAVLGAVALTVHPGFGGGNDTADRQEVGAGAGVTTSGAADTGKPSATPSPSAKEHKPSASATESGAAGSGKGPARSTGSGATGAVPLTVGTRPYVYDSPCSQHFLVDSEPAQVGPPASEDTATRWAAAYGAVSSDEQEVALTVQGTGAETVVLEALHVRVLSRHEPLAWNDYSMGVGCGGGVETKSFDVDLDNGSPTVTVKGGQRDFPYKVSESDPEVFYVVAHTKAHDVRWDLTLDWSSGSRRGTVHIDNAGTAFRTSADAGRPGYDYPLGGSEWIKRDN